MKRAVILACVCLTFSACGQETSPTATQPYPAAAALRGDAAAAVQQFGAQLKNELQQAMAAGGAMQAVDICHLRAPAIADELSAQTGYQLARVSLKFRNPERGQPAAWQRAVLESFDQQLAAGTPADDLIYSATRDGEYRFMKAIPTGALCLTCHGTALAPELEAKLKDLYPEDRATGYLAGELRGAFVAVRPLQSAGR